MGQFETDLAFEKRMTAEHFKPWFKELGWTLSPYGPKNPLGDYAISKKRASRDIELKAEKNWHKNAAIEIWSHFDAEEDEDDCSPGWLYTLNPKTTLLYCLGLEPKEDAFYPITSPVQFSVLMEELQEFIEENEGNYRLKEPWSNKNQENQTFFYPVPLKDLEAGCPKTFRYWPLSGIGQPFTMEGKSYKEAAAELGDNRPW